jgi:hypothetical protein
LPIIAITASAANDSDLKLPSPVRGWQSAPDEAKGWAQTLLDWGAMIVGVVAVGCLLFYFIKGRFADSTGSIQSRNDATTKSIETVIGVIILIVAIAFLWQIFWK